MLVCRVWWRRNGGKGSRLDIVYLYCDVSLYILVDLVSGWGIIFSQCTTGKKDRSASGGGNILRCREWAKPVLGQRLKQSQNRLMRDAVCVNFLPHFNPSPSPSFSIFSASAFFIWCRQLSWQPMVHFLKNPLLVTWAVLLFLPTLSILSDLRNILRILTRCTLTGIISHFASS